VPARLNAAEPKFSQIEGRNEGVDHANRIIIGNPVIHSGNKVDCPRSAP
jgi:hypothetical protein